MYKDSHYENKTVARPSYLYTGYSYAGKWASWYQNSHQKFFDIVQCWQKGHHEQMGYI